MKQENHAALARIEWLSRSYQPYRELMAYYQCALMEVETKFQVLNQEFSVQHDRNPIESIKSRMKEPASILEKMNRKGFPISIESLEENISDIAGIRVVCAFIDDIYMLADCFLRQDDIELVSMKDYIKNPKENGYRSLHLIVKVPIFLQSRKKPMKVEIQLRTIAMDWWASIEHKLMYKKNVANAENVRAQLIDCARISAELDERVQRLHQTVVNEK